MAKHKNEYSEHQAQVRRVLRFVGEHRDSGLSLTELANVACLSPYHFERVFRKQTGLTVMQHVRNVKLVESAIQLHLTNRKIVDIGVNGYNEYDLWHSVM